MACCSLLGSRLCFGIHMDKREKSNGDVSFFVMVSSGRPSRYAVEIVDRCQVWRMSGHTPWNCSKASVWRFQPDRMAQHEWHKNRLSGQPTSRQSGCPAQSGPIHQPSPASWRKAFVLYQKVRWSKLTVWIDRVPFCRQWFSGPVQTAMHILWHNPRLYPTWYFQPVFVLSYFLLFGFPWWLIFPIWIWLAWSPDFWVWKTFFLTPILYPMAPPPRRPTMRETISPIWLVIKFMVKINYLIAVALSRLPVKPEKS